MTYAENTTPINRPVKRSFKSTTAVQPAICFLLSRPPPFFPARFPCWLPWPCVLLLLAYHHHFLGLKWKFPQGSSLHCFFHDFFPGGVLLYLIPQNLHLRPSPRPPSSPSCWLDNSVELRISKRGVIFLPKMGCFPTPSS